VVPARFHSPAFRLGRIAPSWKNVRAFLSSEGFDAESLTTFLNMYAPQAALSAEPMPDDEGMAQLHLFLIENDGLTEAAYRTYVRALPGGYSQFPDGVDVSKLQILIEEGRVAFSGEALDFLSAHETFALRLRSETLKPSWKSRPGFRSTTISGKPCLAARLVTSTKWRSCDRWISLSSPGSRRGRASWAPYWKEPEPTYVRDGEGRLRKSATEPD